MLNQEHEAALASQMNTESMGRYMQHQFESILRQRVVSASELEMERFHGQTLNCAHSLSIYLSVSVSI